MKKTGFSDEQITYILRQVEASDPLPLKYPV